ncbi:hypothetical protein IMCC3317_10200 [Kordia antarctica]|uniref:Uncharacterized protein n=1 Tax=Kordia antarctica TaxID=1218801 RepID=A0A7L4ZG40_9FLAO|nr:hypothetical protein IMCC3317_10200 [Kordia antarctica]
MEQEHIHDPFQFQYASSTRKFSVRTKIMAIALVLIFLMILLYEISPETFKLDHFVLDSSFSPYRGLCNGLF